MKVKIAGLFLLLIAVVAVLAAGSDSAFHDMMRERSKLKRSAPIEERAIPWFQEGPSASLDWVDWLTAQGWDVTTRELPTNVGRGIFYRAVARRGNRGYSGDSVVSMEQAVGKMVFEITRAQAEALDENLPNLEDSRPSLRFR